MFLIFRPSSTKSLHINDFPPEIMREIFRHCPSPDSPAPSTRNAPLNIAAVCGSWRDLVLKMPEIWAIIGIRVRGSVPDVGGITQYWTNIAGDHPLSLTFHLLGQTIHMKLKDMLPLETFTLISHAQSLHLRMDVADQRFLFNHIPKDIGLPFLKSLTLVVNSGEDRAHIMWVGRPSLLRSCPSLRHLTIEMLPTLSTVMPLDQGITVDVPWTQLTSLTIKEPRLVLTRAVEILALCPNLVECELGTGCGRGAASWTTKAVVLARLTSLALAAKCQQGHDARPGVTLILDCLTLPALKTLSVSAGWTPRAALAACLLSFQQRSEFALEEFSVMGNIDLEGLRTFLETTPTLESLSVNPVNQSVYPPLLRLLEPETAETRQLLLPNLISLKLTAHAPGIYVNTSGTAKYMEKKWHTRAQAVDKYRCEMEVRSDRLVCMLRSRFRGTGLPRIQGMKQLEGVTLRTWLGGNTYAVDEWMRCVGLGQIEELERRGLFVKFEFEVY
ncbi:hypothetical protein Hypma_003506 [Hypsizygus marmoreus]|uniref:F-box domain-containing protein n=1 Tax=Hypsizygus marmoreus TaxID=39966 RepID=A0A369J8Y0_HYPMA|nr:hypothetical protein Hypma_003506 [Hypsizygus marmoreus]